MSGTFPSTPLPSSVVVRSLAMTQQDVTHSGRRNVRQFGAQKWQLNCTFPATLSRDQFMPMYAFLVSQAGKFGTFLFTPPDLANPRGSPSGTPLVKGGSQTGTSVTTDAWPNNTEIFKAGDVVKFTNSPKVYMLSADVTSDGSGNATLPIYPPLTESPINNEAVVYSNVPFTVQLISDTSEYAVRGPLLYSFSVELVEVI